MALFGTKRTLSLDKEKSKTHETKSDIVFLIGANYDSNKLEKLGCLVNQLAFLITK